MSLWNAARAVIGKKLGTTKPAAEDAGLPFNARIGSLITINASPFLRAHGSLLRSPGKTHTIKAISKMHIDLNGALYRYYVEKGDSGDDRETYIQVYASSDGNIKGIEYFDRLLRMYPETDGDYAAFTGGADAGLGQIEFSLHREQLEDLGYESSVLDTAFQGEETLPYARTTSSKEEYIKPFEGEERRIDDSLGNQGMRQRILFMPYERDLMYGTKEQLFISTEMIKSQNGVEKDSIHVDFMLGLTLSDADVSIQ